MWKYHRPGFESLLLAELQRQQRCSQFCDTVLRAEGVSVPAHSCILSALSPQLSCALASGLPPPSGQRHLLEFKDFRASALLRLVSLLYSGEMTGEGEVDRCAVITAAARMGIHGLVEVGHRNGRGDTSDRGRDGETPGQRNVGVQTESIHPQSNRGMAGERNGQPDEARDCQDANFLPPQVSHIPLSQVLLYPPEGPNPTALMAPIEEWPGAGHAPIYLIPPPQGSLTTATPVSFPPVAVLGDLTESVPTFSSDIASQSWGAGTNGHQGVAKDRAEGQEFEQFEGNIAGFISYFLNPTQEKGARGGRRRGRRREVGTGGRRAGGGGRRARRPRGQPQGGAGGTRSTKNIAKEAGGPSATSRGQRCRWGGAASRIGRGGGVVGRKVYLKTRDMLKPIKIRLRRRGRGEVWEISSPVKDQGDEAVKQSRKRGRSQNNAMALPLLNQNGFPVIKTQQGRVKTVPFPAFSEHLYNALTNEPESHSSSPAVSLSPPAHQRPPAPYLSPAPALLHTARLPPLAQPVQEDTAEQFERLLEDIMLGLDLMPSVATVTQHGNSNPQRDANKGGPGAPPTGRTYVDQCQDSYPTCLQGSVGNTSDVTTGTAPAGVPAATGKGGFGNDVAGVHQPQGEGNLNDILENFLWSFEQQVAVTAETHGGSDAPQVDSTTADSQSQPYTLIKNHEGQARSATGTHASNRAHMPLPHAPSLPPIQNSTDIHTASTTSDLPAVESAHHPLSPRLICASLPPCPSPAETEMHKGEGGILTRRQARKRTAIPEESSSQEEGIPKDTAHNSHLSLTPPSKQSQPNVPSEPPSTAEQAKRLATRQVVETNGGIAKKRRTEEMAKRKRIRKLVSRRRDRFPQRAGRVQAAGRVVRREKRKPLTESKRQPLTKGPIRSSPRFRQLKQDPINQDRDMCMAETLPVPVTPPIKRTHTRSPPTQIPFKTHPIGNNSHHKICWNELHNKPSVLQQPAYKGVSVLPTDPVRWTEEDGHPGGPGDAKPRRGRGRPKRTTWPEDGGAAVATPSALPPLEKRTYEETEEDESELEERIEWRREREWERYTNAEEEREREEVCREPVGLDPPRRELLRPNVAGADLTACQALNGPVEEEPVTPEQEEDVDIERVSSQANETIRTAPPTGSREEVGGERGQEGGKHMGRWELETKEGNRTEEGTKKEAAPGGSDEEEEDDIIDVEEDSDVSIDVVGEEGEDWAIQEQDHMSLQRKTMAWSHSGTAKCPGRSNLSHCTGEVSPGSTGCGKEEEEEEEVDVLGESGFSSDPLSWTWGAGLRPEEEAEEEEIDVIGEDRDCTPSIGPLSFLVGKRY